MASLTTRHDAIAYPTIASICGQDKGGTPGSPTSVRTVPAKPPAERAAMRGLLGRDAPNQRRSLRETDEKTPKKSSIRKLKVHRASGFVAKPKCDQPIHKSRSVSATIARPSATETMMKPPICQVSGFLEGRTWSVANAIDAKSITKTSSNIAEAETTNWPVTTNAMATNDDFKIVWLTLLMIQVKRCW